MIFVSKNNISSELVLQFCVIFSSILSGRGSISAKSGHWNYVDEIIESGLCGASKVSFTKFNYLYTWEVKGILPYLEYVENFDQTFTHEIKDVRFESPEHMNGTWNFRIRSLKNSLEPYTQTHISADYKYLQTAANKQMNIGLDIQIKINHDYWNYNASRLAVPGATVSIRKPTHVTAQKIRVKSKKTPPVSIQLVTPSEGQAKPKKRTEKETSRILPSTWFSTDPDSSEEKDFFSEAEEDVKTKDSGDQVIASMTFDSINIQPKLVEIRNALKGATATDIQLIFRILVFYPNEEVEPVRSNSCRRFETRFFEPVPERQPYPIQAIVSPEKALVVTSEPAKIVQMPCQTKFPPFVSNMESMFMNRSYSDLVVRVKNFEFPVHRVILIYSSPVLASMLRTSSSVLDLTDFNVTSIGMEETLRFLYTGNLRSDLTWDTAADALRLAYKLGIESLKQVCEEYLLTQVRVDSVIQLYSLSKDIFSPSLVKAAIEFIKRNKQAVISQSEEFHGLTTKYPMLMFELFMTS